MDARNVNQAQDQIGRGAVLGVNYDKPSEAMAGEACCARQNAKGAIRDRASRLRREADRLEALAQSLPEAMLPAVDEALWDLVTSARR